MAKVNKLILERNPGINQLYDVIEDMTHYIHENNIDVVVVGGSGAQPVAVEVRKHWKRLFSKEVMPKFVALGNVSSTVSGLSVDQIKQLFLSRSKNIADKGSKKCFVLEEFMSGGSVMKKLHSAMKLVGFNKVLLGSLLLRDRSFTHAENLDFVGALSKTEPKFDVGRREAILRILKLRASPGWKEKRKNSIESIKFVYGRRK